MPVPEETTRSSPLAEQFGHRLIVRDRTGAPGCYPLPVSGQRGLDVGFLQQFRRCVALYRLELTQIPERDDGSPRRGPSYQRRMRSWQHRTEIL